MSAESNQAELFARVDFPLYAINMISPRHVLVAGGGGAANTGVKNGFEIFEIINNGEQIVGESITRHETGSYNVYSLSVRNGASNNNLPHSVMLAAGHNEFCQLYKLTLDRDKKSRDHSDGVHRRVNGVPAGAQHPNSESPMSQLVFKTETMKKVQIDFNAGEPYGKVIRISLNGKYLASGGDDGHLRVFSFPDLDKVHDFATHEKEIDDLDFSPDSTKICSISKDKRAILWDVKKGKKHAELGWDNANNIKYMYKRVKFGCVEGDSKKYKIYTISNPIGSSKAPSYLHRWSTQSCTVEGAVQLFGSAFSALAVSDNGNFVATGTMSEGIVDIYTSYNLNRVKRVRNSHSTFITGLEFIPCADTSAVVRGWREASVISISVDHQVCIHHVPELPTVSSLSAMILVVLVLVATFIISSYLGI